MTSHELALWADTLGRQVRLDADGSQLGTDGWHITTTKIEVGEINESMPW